ncbi:MAG: metal-dependent hydrolase [Methylococcales bacterium]|nr:metal-dependent hydrolase [Methylococcales bacterium]
MTPSQPDCISIKARKVDFGFSGELPYRWYDGNLAVFNLCNAISMMFPVGEQFFIDSVLHYKDQIKDPLLQKQVMGFIAQEAMHSKQHDLSNQVLKVHNPQLCRLEKVASSLLGIARALYPARTQLATSCALEHFTAMFADHLLSSSASFIKLSQPAFAELWLWHAVEETEHKAVCFDVYQQVAAGKWSGYIERCLVMGLTTLFMLIAILLSAVLLNTGKAKQSPQQAPKQRPVSKGKPMMAWLRYLFVKPGIIRLFTAPYFKYYLPSFHPWQHDNSALVEAWKAQHEKSSPYGKLK